jgi:hypothetical protein
MEINSSPERIEKFNKRLGTICLREFKATFTIVVYGLELKYGANYTKAFAFKQLPYYLHYEALDVYEQHYLRILGIAQIPNIVYATTIAIASQVTLQIAIPHHGIVPNNPDLVLTSVNFSPQQLIDVTANILPTIDAPIFTNPVGEFFQVFKVEFFVKSFEKIIQLTTFFRQKDETLKMLYRRPLKLKEDT